MLLGLKTCKQLWKVKNRDTINRHLGQTLSTDIIKQTLSTDAMNRHINRQCQQVLLTDNVNRQYQQTLSLDTTNRYY